MKKKLVLFSLLMGSTLTVGAVTPIAAIAADDQNVTTYLVLSRVGTYSGTEQVKSIPSLYLENAIEYVAKPGSALPGKDKVGTISSSDGKFVSWVAYEGTGAPTKYTTVPEKSGKILYAFFSLDNSTKTLIDLRVDGELEKTTYNLNDGDTFSTKGITVYADFSDDTSENVTSEVSWSSLKPNDTSITGTYTYKGVTKSVTINGLTVTGTEVPTSMIYLDAGGSSLWDQAGAWMAAYCWTSTGGEQWFKMEKQNNYYVAEIDTNIYSNIIFTRMRPQGSAGYSPDSNGLNWENPWNQTNDLTFDGNLFTITGWGSGGKSTGSWSTIN